MSSRLFNEIQEKRQKKKTQDLCTEIKKDKPKTGTRTLLKMFHQEEQCQAHKTQHFHSAEMSDNCLSLLFLLLYFTI